LLLIALPKYQYLLNNEQLLLHASGKALNCKHRCHEHLYGKFRGVLKERRVKSFFAGFDVTLDPVVVRAMPSRSPREGNVPALEKILVDMYLDIDKYSYIGHSDYFELWWDLVRLYRINIRELIGYSRRRKCLRQLFPQLIDNTNSYAIAFCQLIAKVGKRL